VRPSDGSSQAIGRQLGEFAMLEAKNTEHFGAKLQQVTPQATDLAASATATMNDVIAVILTTALREVFGVSRTLHQ
jgi:hypothetical protein